jgi:SAM-dependent methyltransferase
MTAVRDTVDPAKLESLVMKALGDFGATFSTAMISLGERLGLFVALAGGGGLTSAELAAKTETSERYVREWLAACAAGGYVEYEPDTGRFSLTPEQQTALVDESSPYFIIGGFELIMAALRAEPEIAERFRSGDGFSWGAHDPRLFEGTERFFRPGYAANLVSQWIPALDGVEDKLRTGALVADVGCGHGASTIELARAFSDSSFVGFDSHAPSIARASQRAADAGVEDRVRFEVAEASTFPGQDYNLIAHFDCLHDMGDPLRAARRARQAIARDGTWLIVEPNAGDRLEDNLNPVGRVFYGASTLLCTPHSISEGGQLSLGAQAGEARLREVAEVAGFTRFRRAAETPFNLVLEARP